MSYIKRSLKLFVRLKLICKWRTVQDANRVIRLNLTGQKPITKEVFTRKFEYIYKLQIRVYARLITNIIADTI